MQAAQEGLKCKRCTVLPIKLRLFVTSGKDSNNTWMIIAIVSATLFAVVVVVIGMTLCVRFYKGKMKKSQMDPTVLYNSKEDQKPLKPQDS